MIKEVSSRASMQEALQKIWEITSQYQTCPNYESLSEAENALLLRKIVQAGNAIAKSQNRELFFFDDIVKHARNVDAHSINDNPKEINKIYQNVFSWILDAQAQLIESIDNDYSDLKNVRGFEKFSTAFKSEKKRKEFVDSINSNYNDTEYRVTFDNKTDQALSDAAHSVLNPTNQLDQSLLDFAKENNLEDSIESNIVDFVEKTNDFISKNNPFGGEKNFIDSLSKLSPSEIKKQFEHLKQNYKSLDSVKQFASNADFDFFKKQFDKKDFADDIVARNLVDELKKELVRRQTEWELKQIEEERKKFLEELYKKIEQFNKLKNLLKTMTKNFGRLWGLAESEFQDSGLDILEQFADLLEKDEGLQELAKLIGKHYDEQESFRKEIREKVVIESYKETLPAYKGEISGLKLSDSISDSLVSELALYSNPKTRQIFKMKYAQKQLLSYSYTRNVDKQKSHLEKEEVSVGESKQEKGPMIICVDTSGSMHGQPEQVAKTIAWALAQKSFEEERKCYLISFSTGIQTMDLSSFNSMDGFKNLQKFLRMSFWGGTDVHPALYHSVEMMQKNDWKNADLLMVSDFVMSGISPDLKQKIDNLKKKNSRFYSLAITSSYNQKVLDCFTQNWIYDLYDKNASKNLVRQLDKIGK